MRRAGAVLVLALGVVSALGTAGRVRDGAPVGTRPAQRPAVRTSSAFLLFASTNLLLNANRVQCNVNSIGEHCVSPTNSSVVGGGFWPKGTSDQYIFNGGLEIAAVVPGDRTAFGWAGDTVGAYIFDERGDQSVGSPLAGIFDSRNPADLENWPSAAYVRDTALFDASLIGRKAASEQDSWVRYWDGEAASMAPAYGWGGRPHSMGLLIDQRTLAWNRPEAGRDILFVLFRLINVTARDRSRYAGLAAAGYTPEDIAEIAKIGADYHARSDTGGVSLPDTGFTWTNLYVAIGQDPDVGFAGQNYSTAVLPFATAVAYKSNFLEPTWTYPPEVFAPPFATAPGLVGTKFLRVVNGPVTGSSDIRMFTNLTGGAPFPARKGVAALWRLLSNHLLPADGTCNAPPGTPLCQLVSVPVDTHWHMSSGPWPAVGAGQSVAFVIAYVFAAPLAAALQSDGRGSAFGSASFDLKPGIPATGPRLAAGTDTVRQIERVAGWTSFGDADGNGDVEQGEVRVQPYSLLGKAAVAQALADNKFVLASPPAAPRFFLLPGDGQVTVVWERSVTEVTGDPYFAVASSPLGQVYDPNLRQFDVEGYRIWRGTSPSSLQLVAQFDYAGTTITDHTGQIFTGAPPSNCAPELGVVGCGADFLHGGTLDVPLAGNVVQVPPGGRVLLTSGAVATFRADTAVSGGGSGLPPLQDTEIRFVYVDEAVRNSTPYYYAVTAFDVNSINSGPSSLESEWVVKSVQPRVTGSNAHAATVVTGVYGADGTRLDPEAPWPKIDSARGTFDGPIPPANRGAFALVGAAQELLPAGEFVARIDSISPGLAEGYGQAPTMYVTFIQPGQSFQKSIVLPVPSYAIPSTDTSAFRTVFPFVPLDSAQARRYRVQLGEDLRMPVKFYGLLWPLNWTPMGGALARGRWPTYDATMTAADRFIRHSYWYMETATTQPLDPTIDPYGSAAHSAGQLTGVTTIYAPAAYRQASAGGAAARSVNLFTRAYSSNPMWYPADFVVTWGSGGAITVRDSTHRTNLPFKKSAQIGYGFISAANIVAAGITSGDLSDGQAGTTFDPAVVSYHSLYTINTNCTDYWGITCADLAQNAVLQPIDYTADGVSDGNGIALVINGEPFFMLMSALPALGTKWHLKAIGGGHMNATCTPAIPASGDVTYANRPTDCSGYTFTPAAFRPAFAPGLQFKISVTRTAGADSTSGDLNRIHTVPDPVYFTDLTAAGQPPTVRFVNLPDRAVIRIYSASGILVTMLTHNDATAGGEEVWDLTNRGGRWVASGVYFYHVEGPDHRVKIGRFTVVHQQMP